MVFKKMTGGLGRAVETRFDKIAAWHHHFALFGKIGTLPKGGAFLLIAVLVGLLAGMANYDIRQSQYDVWVDNKALTHLGETPLFSTTDASYFIGLARQYNATGDVLDYEKTRLYPYNQQKLSEAPAKEGMRDFPLLSVIIATLSPDNSVENLLKTGNALIPLFGFVMAIGILLAFGASGFWLEGAVAAIGAGLAPTFLMRSAIGRIDTDILNLGFFYAVLGLTIFAARATNWRAAIAWVIAAALCLNLFFWWYDKAFMGWAFTVGLVWLSLVTSRDWRRPLVLGGLFILLSGLLFKGLGVIGSDSAYLQDVGQTGALIFPNTFETITELRVVPFAQIMNSITGGLWMGVLGVIGLGLFAYRHPVLAVVYGPATIFALANFLIGNRAVFYSAPMIWFGVAFLAVFAVRLIWAYAPKLVRSSDGSSGSLIGRYGEIGAIGVVIMALMGTIYQKDSTQTYLPNPSFPVEMMRGFAAAKGNLPEGSVIATWWDYGYASHLFNGYNTLHDGGAQTTPVTHYFARALLAKTQGETNAILHSLGTDGLKKIQDNSASHERVEAALLAGAAGKKAPLFLVLTEQMAGWMGSISNLGMWDTKTGTPINALASPYGPTLFYREMVCREGANPSEPICDNQKMNLKLGTINDQPVIAQITRSQQGALQARAGHHDKGLTVIHLADITDKGTRVLSLHQRLAQSSFHNLFHLGAADPAYFEMVYDDYPFVRIFAVK